MKKRIIIGAILVVAVISCSCLSTQAPKSADSHPQIQYTVKYVDRNNDGKIDYEKHTAMGACDADWELRDDNFDGRYETQKDYGFAVIEHSVDLPVPVQGNGTEK